MKGFKLFIVIGILIGCSTNSDKKHLKKEDLIQKFDLHKDIWNFPDKLNINDSIKIFIDLSVCHSHNQVYIKVDKSKDSIFLSLNIYNHYDDTVLYINQDIVSFNFNELLKEKMSPYFIDTIPKTIHDKTYSDFVVKYGLDSLVFNRKEKGILSKLYFIQSFDSVITQYFPDYEGYYSLEVPVE